MPNELFQLVRDDIGELKTEVRQNTAAVHALRDSVTRTAADHAARITVLEAKGDKTILGLPVLQFVNVLLLGVILAMSGWTFLFEGIASRWMP